MGFTVIIGKSKGHEICSLMQMTSLYILELLRVHATFNLPKGQNEKGVREGETERQKEGSVAAGVGVGVGWSSPGRPLGTWRKNKRLPYN